jgi:hypothetical protein
LAKGEKKPIEAENGEKKIRMRKEEHVENVGKHLSFYTKKNEIMSAYFSNMPIILFVYKEKYFITNNLDFFIPSIVMSMLQDFPFLFKFMFPSHTFPHIKCH